MPIITKLPKPSEYRIRKNLQWYGKHHTGSIHINGTVTVDKSRIGALQLLSTTAGSELVRVQVYVK